MSQENLPLSSKAQLSLERVIIRTLREYDVHIEVDECIRNAFKCKLWRMGQQLSKCGGRKRSQLLAEWKASSSVWELTLDLVEVNKHLLRGKRKAEAELSGERAKREKVEGKLKEVTNELQVVKSTCKKAERANKALSCTIAGVGSRKSRKSLCNLSRQRKHERKKQALVNIQAALSFLENDGLKATSVDVTDVTSSQAYVADIQSGSFSSQSCTNQTVQSNTKLDMVLYVKEKFNLSREAYHELSIVVRDLPRSSVVQKRVQELNNKWSIKPCPANLGVQQSRVFTRIQSLINSRKIDPSSENVISLKLTGDGTNLGRNIHIVNFAFTLLQEGALVQSPSGNHTIAILKCRESYSELFTGLSDIREEVCNLSTIVVDGHEFTVNLYLGGDWKFLAVLCGIDAANAHYSCIWCKYPSNEHHNMEKTWSIRASARQRDCGIPAIFAHIPHTLLV